MNPDSFFRRPIPHGEAAAYFIGLKKFGSAAAPSAAGVLDELGAYGREEQLEILKEAGVSAEDLAGIAKEAFAVTDKGHQFDAERARMLEGHHLDRARLLQAYQAEGHVDPATGKNPATLLNVLRFHDLSPFGDDNHAVGAARHQNYVAGKHEQGQNAWNPLGGMLTAHPAEEGGTSGFLGVVGKVKPKEKKAAQSGKERAHSNLEAKHETHRHSRGEQLGEIAGKTVGAVGGFLGGGIIAGKDPTTRGAGALLGGGAGAHIGGRIGKVLGKEIDAARYKKHAAAFKLALQDMPDLAALAAQEEEASAAQEVAEASFYRQKAQEAQAQLEATTQQTLQAQQQIQALQQQVAGNDAQLQQAMQQAQMTQQAALTNVQQAHSVATQATQQALQASDEALKNQQMAAAMRMAFQEMRGNMMDLASQDSAADVGAQLSGKGLETTPATPPITEQGPAVEAVSPELPPNAAPPDGAQAPTAPAEAAPQQNMQPAAELKTAGIKEHITERLPYAAAGALLGGAGTALEAHRGHDNLRDKVQKLEAAKGGGFSQALDLARAKAMLAMGEVTEQHPIAATLAGSLTGAALVGSGGPSLMEGGKKLFGRMAG